MNDPALRQLAVDAYRELATDARQRPEMRLTAANYLNRLAAIEPSGKQEPAQNSNRQPGCR